MKRAAKFLGILFLVLISVAYVGAGLSRISLNVDILRLLPTKLKQVEGLSQNFYYKQLRAQDKVRLVSYEPL